MTDNQLHKGGCHCGRVRFEFNAPAKVPSTRCNCSACAMVGYQHIIVPKTQFTLLGMIEELGHYKFNTETAQHYFCKTCGVKSFYQPRSHPAAWSVNYRCIDAGTLQISETIDFDGQNWEDNVEGLLDAHTDK